MKNFFQRKNLSKILLIFLLVIFFGNLFFRVFQYKDNYLVKFDAKYWEHRYQISQWMVPNSKNSIGDDGLYAYAGYMYLFKGLNPILVNAEFPPLGKYLIGFTILIFQNQNVFGLLTGISTLSVFYLLNKKLFKNNFLAFLPVFAFSMEPIFWEQLQANYVDLLYLTFLLLAFLFVLNKKYLFTSIALGCFAATKFPPTSIFLFLALATYVFFHARKDVLKFSISLVAWPAVFVLSYFRFFMLGNGVISFLKVLKYFLHFYSTGAKSPDHLMVFDLLIRGKLITWWGSGVLSAAEWNLLWPIAVGLTLISFYNYKKIIKSPFILIIAWIILYFAFLMVIPVTTRYLLLLLPFLYNVSVWVLSEGINTKYSRRLGLQRFISSFAS